MQSRTAHGQCQLLSRLVETSFTAESAEAAENNILIFSIPAFSAVNTL